MSTIKSTQKWLRALLWITVFGLLGAGLGFWLARVFGAQGTSLTEGQRLLAIAAALVALWFSLAVHELSHAIAGLAQGFHLQQIVVGFLGIRRSKDNNRLVVYFNTDMTFFGGMCAMVPQTPTPHLRWQYAWVLLAGPLGSLLFGVFGIWAFWAMRTVGYAFAQPASIFLLTLGLGSFAVFLATTLPSRTGIFLTDRARFFRLVSSGPEAQAEQQMLHLVALDTSGFPWEHLDPAAFAAARQDATYGLYVELYVYWHYLAQEQWEQALSCAERFEAVPKDWPEALKVVFWKEICFAYAWLSADAAAAQPWWERIQRQTEHSPDSPGLRAKAAWLSASGHFTAARQAIEEALSLLGQRQQKTSSEHAEQRLLENMFVKAVAEPSLAFSEPA